MKQNVGGPDRVERIITGIVFILIGVFLVTDFWQYLLAGYGVLRLTTGIFAFCPVYLPFKYSTRKK